MFLIAGLGNPGPSYASTRHNIGFMAVDAFADHVNASMGVTKYKNIIRKAQKSTISFLLSQPQSFMNKSGEALHALCRFYRIELKNLIIIHDDIDLTFGEVRVKIGGGHAGHNGLRNIDACLGKEYTRVRIGIGRPIGAMDVADFVLQKFTSDEMYIMNLLLEKIAKNIHVLTDFSRKDEFLASVSLDC